jgi:hypothetical protein
MKKYRLWNLLIGSFLMLQPLLIVQISDEKVNWFISGLGSGIGICLIIFLEVIFYLFSQNQKEVKKE